MISDPALACSISEISVSEDIKEPDAVVTNRKSSNRDGRSQKPQGKATQHGAFIRCNKDASLVLLLSASVGSFSFAAIQQAIKTPCVADCNYRLQSVVTTIESKMNITKAVSFFAVVGALVLGIWIANTSWRSRKQIWQIQSALIGGSVGFVAGRLTSKKG